MVAEDDERLGDATSVQAYTAERDIAWVRFAIIAFNVALYLGVMPHDHPQHRLALIICAAASFYAVFVVTVRPYERFHILRTSAYTLATDSVLIALWLYATGGILSPFYGLWALSLVAVVFRFGPSMVALAAGIYMAADTSMLVAAGDVLPENLPTIAARATYISVTGVLGMLLGYRWQAAVRERMDLAQEVRHQEMMVAEAERIRALTEAAFEGICIHRDGVILEFNEAFAALLGKGREELLGSDLRTLVDPSSAELVEDRLANPRDESYELWLGQGDEKRRVMVQARPIEYRGMPARVVAARDITVQFEAERARTLAHEQQMEIDRLKELDEFRTRFINSAAHELNTPLTPIKLQFAVLRDEWQGRPRALGLLERNLDRLGGLVQDMLDVARLQRGDVRVSAREVDLVPELTDLVETFAASAQAAEVSLALDMEGPAVAWADPDRLAQVMTNLVSNALKFTPRGGAVTVAVAPAEAKVRIEVRDTGVGLGPDGLKHLFLPFGQVHDDPRIPGTGLGLYICKTLTQALGGTIGAMSEGAGKGACFWVELPATPPPVASVGGDARQPAP